MAIPATRQQMIDWCLRKLGSPVININVEASQLDDRIDEALQVYNEQHYDGTEEVWSYFTITQDDINNGYIAVPSNVLSITRIFPSYSLTSGESMFDFNYQVIASNLSPFQPFDSLDYYMKSVDIGSTIDLTTVEPTFQFSRHAMRLIPATNMNKFVVGDKFAVQMFTIIDPDVHGAVYNDKWLKEYATSLIKRQWGENMKKFGGVQLLGGVELNGKEIYDEAVEEILRLTEELETKYQEPVDFLFG